MKKKNPLNQDEINRQKVEVARIEPDLESDEFSESEQKQIVKQVIDDAKLWEETARDWKQQKMLDILHLSGGKPSVIENLKKKAWMSDRNLGICPAVCDIYQATLLATCYNPDSIHFKATEQNDVDNKDNLEKFTKWALGDSESKFFPEVDDFIANRVGQGFSLFKIEWEVKYLWVDKRIPKRSKDNKKRIIGYDLELEERRFERGVIRNIDHLDDILIPEYGKDVHDLTGLIEIVHTHLDTLEEMADRNRIVNFDAEKKIAFLEALNKAKTEEKTRNVETEKLGAGASKPAGEAEERNVPVDIYEYYGWFKKNGRREMFRFWVEPTTETFLAGKPLRKIMRDGRIPYEGGPLRRRPGFLRGGSLPSLIADPVNALNNVFNQKSDYQTFENCPDGYYDKNNAEGLDASIRDVEPGLMKPVDGNPSESIFFPTRQRSMAWADQDQQFLMEVIERLTGAASYFLTSQQPDTTATRDNIVEEKGQTKFGLWVKRIQTDIARAINRYVGMYQDWAPSNLGTRVLGDDGKAIIKNLSIDSLRGNYDAYLVPDITNGSKAFERQLSVWGYNALQTSVWFDPRLNPRGNWLLVKDTMKRQGYANPEHMLPPQPKDAMDYSKEAEAHFNLLKQGDRPEPPREDNPQIVECFATFLRLKETKVHELDEEYRANFDDYFFKAMVNYRKFIQRVQQEKMEMAIAANAAGKLEKMMPRAQAAPQQPAQAMP